MRIVVDTNVLVSGLMNPWGVPAAILGLIIEAKVIPCYDARILQEYAEVLRRPKFGFDHSEIDALLQSIRDAGAAVVASPNVVGVKHTGDIPFAQVAVGAHARFLVTGNTSHFPQTLDEARVVTPRVFLDAFLGETESNRY